MIKKVVVVVKVVDISSLGEKPVGVWGGFVDT